MFWTIVLALVSSQLIAQNSPKERAAWNERVAPFRIIGNIYYVGASGVSAFLVTTPNGAILLDGGFPETAPLIEKSISELGFHLSDVKFLLNSHAHYDHCGGLTELKRLSGAKMIASEGDSTALSVGWQLNCADQDASFPPVKIDRVVGDKETVQLGGSIFTVHLTPGHTKGCTTWSTVVSEGGKAYNVVFYCSTTVGGNRLVKNSAYPSIVSDYKRSFAKPRDLLCDVDLAPHGSFFRRDDKRPALEPGRKYAFVDPTEMQKYVDQSEQAFDQELIRQQASAAQKR